MNDRLPEIAITPRDMARLDVLTGVAPMYRTPAQEMLARELGRARIVASHRLARGTVTMGSTVRYRTDGCGLVWTATLVFPGEEDEAAGRLSVLTPLGSALVGLCEGQSIGYDAADGKRRTLTVIEVLPAGSGRPRGGFAGRDGA